LVSTPTRFKIIGAETLVAGAFLLLTFFLNQSDTGLSRWLPKLDADMPIVGGAMILIGLEIFSLIKHLPSPIPTTIAQGAPTDPSVTELSKGRLISVRKLVALDMALHGRRLILLEFGISAPGLMAAGLVIIFKGYWPLGAYLLMLGINYVTLLIYAVSLKGRHEELKNRNRLEISRTIRRYGIQQTLLLVPFAMPILAILQRSVRSVRNPL
jgi:hypothetical protein